MNANRDQARERTVHELKIWPVYYQPILDDIKRFEIRYDDRGYKIGDLLYLREWEPAPGGTGAYTGRESYYLVEFILYNGPGLEPGYVAMAIAGPWATKNTNGRMRT